MDIKGNMPNFRHVTKDEIECKISKIKPGKGLSILVYKDARTDIKILNETIGSTNWQCDYKEIKGNMYCGVSIFDTDKNQWITKWDCGVESDFGDKAKGEASDAFKRACVKWGIGVELYSAPSIWIPNSKCDIFMDEGKPKCNDKFEIEKIAIENHTITGISIINKSMNNKRAFVWYTSKEAKVTKEEKPSILPYDLDSEFEVV